MSRRFVSADDHAWRYVAEFVRIGREALGLKVDEAVGRSDGQISKSVWSILENARQDKGRMEAESLRGASQALGLSPRVLEELVTADIQALTPKEAWRHLSEGPDEFSPDLGLAARVEILEGQMAEVLELVRGIAGESPSPRSSRD